MGVFRFFILIVVLVRCLSFVIGTEACFAYTGGIVRISSQEVSVWIAGDDLALFITFRVLIISLLS